VLFSSSSIPPPMTSPFRSFSLTSSLAQSMAFTLMSLLYSFCPGSRAGLGGMPARRFWMGVVAIWLRKGKRGKVGMMEREGRERERWKCLRERGEK